MRSFALPVFATAFVLASSAHAGRIYVDRYASGGIVDGTSWANAYRGSSGLVVALSSSAPGDEIWVANGTYLPTQSGARGTSFQLRNGVAIYGGFAGDETSLSQRGWYEFETVLSGDIGGPSTLDNSYHVVNGSNTNATAILDGFYVRDGYANVAGSNSDRGAGLYCNGGTGPTIRNCRFIGNRSTGGGGGAYVAFASPVIQHVRFEDCDGGTAGGAVQLASSASVLDRCIFLRNRADRGGAVDFASSPDARVDHGVFVDNVASGGAGGGAIHSASNLSVRNCTLARNRADTHESGGLRVAGGTTSVLNSILWENAGVGGGQTSANQISGSASVSYSIVQGGYAGTAVRDVDPQFTSPAGGNFRPTATSPAVDAGDNAVAAGGAAFELDVDFRPRFTDAFAIADTGVGGAPIVDLGAYELLAATTVAVCFGDGSGSACPCANEAPAGSATGCRNSLGHGASLTASGLPRITEDTLVLQGAGMPNGSSLYFQGTAHVANGEGVAFGDGLLCAGGSVVRIGVKQNVGGSSRVDAPIHVWGQVQAGGSERVYQCWYRNSASFCTASAFNLTNAVWVYWTL